MSEEAVLENHNRGATCGGNRIAALLVNQMIYLLDFATCPCGHATPIRPSTLALPKGDQKWSASGEPFVTLVCGQCKRVFDFDPDGFESKQTVYGVSPYNPESPLHLFGMTKPCGREGCATPLQIVVVRKSDTSDEALLAEIADWWWEDLTCPSGHPIPDRKHSKR
jgi:hypothetical protein